MVSRRQLTYTLSAVAAATMLAAPVNGTLSQPLPARRRRVSVDNAADLELALNAAGPGDHIVLADGIYDGDFTLARHGTAEQPIVVRAATPHAARLTGFFNLDSDHGWLQQLLFQPARLKVTGSDTKVLRYTLRDSSGGLDVICICGNGARTEIAYEEVRDFGELHAAHPCGKSVRVTSGDRPQAIHIHHNRVHNQRGQHVDIDVLAAAILLEPSDTVIQAAHGSVSMLQGKISCTPVAGHTGGDSFTYRLTNGARFSKAVISITVKSAVSQEQGGAVSELPAPLRNITVKNQSELNSAKTAAQPGDHIVMANGSYDLGQVTKGGVETAPVVFKAASNQAVTVTGFAGFSASHVRLWGMDLSGSPQPAITGSHVWVIRCKIRKAWRINAPFARFWYCDCQIPNNANSRCLEFANAQGATDYHVYKCYFHDSHNNSGNNFEEMVQCGFGNNLTNVKQRGLIEECLFKNIGQGNSSSETIGIKGSGVTVLSCTYDNARSINVRHGAGSRIELCYMKGNSRINVRDADSLVLNNKCVDDADITVFAGDVAPDEDGGNSANWQSGVYPYGFRTLLYNNETATVTVIGRTFSNASLTPLPAKNTVIQGHRGTLPTINFAVGTNPSNQWTQTAPFEVEIPVELTQSDVGLFAGL